MSLNHHNTPHETPNTPPDSPASETTAVFLCHTHEPRSVLIRPGYVTKAEALEITGRSEKRLEQAIARAGIETVYVPRPGKRPFPTYPEPDIRALRPAPRAPNAPKADPIEQLTAVIADIGERLLPPAAAPAIPASEIAAKQLLTMEEAHRLGWPMTTLRELKRRRNPPGVRYGRRGFRFSADALRRISDGYSEEQTAHDAASDRA